MNLNARQKAFCEFYVACGNATEAAKRAGYSARTAKSIGQENLTKPDLQKYIQELQKKAQSSRIMTSVERKEWLTQVLQSEEVRLNEKLKALDILNKMDGEYTEKVQLSGEINSNPLQGLTTEEVRRLAKE